MALAAVSERIEGVLAHERAKHVPAPAVGDAACLDEVSAASGAMGAHVVAV
jgi:hypothetical protein